MMKRFLTTVVILLSTICLSNVTVKAELTYDLNGNQVDVSVWTKQTSLSDGSFKVISSEAGTITYFDDKGNLIKVADEGTEEVLFTVNEDGRLVKAEPTTEAETTTVAKAVEKITLPKVKKLKKKICWKKYIGVKAVKKDKNKTPVWGKIKYRYGITVSWKRIKGVTGYEIYRQESATGKWINIKTIKKNKKNPSYTLTDMLQGENVKIKIRAYKNTKTGKVYGKYSNVLKFETKNLYTKIYKNARYKVFYSKWASQDAFVVQNKYRKEAGVQPLVWSDVLYDITISRSKELVKDFSHSGFFKTPSKILFSEKYDDIDINTRKIWSSYIMGENIAYGFTTPQKTMTGWKRSKGHYNLLMDKRFGYSAIGCYHSGDATYWTALFIDTTNEGKIARRTWGEFEVDFSLLK